MSISIPTCNEIGTALQRAVRSIAIIAVAFYVAGEMCGRFMYRLSDWLVELTRKPVDTLLKLVPTKPKPSTLKLLGAQVLSDKELEEEIKMYEKKEKKKPRPARRRKPKVTKVEAGA